MPLTEAQRAKFAAILNEVVTTPNDTKTKKERKDAFDKSFGKTTPTSEIAAKIEAAQAVVWIPHAYVLFARRATCKSCGASERCLDTPQLFLQKRKAHKDESNPYIYEGVKETEFSSLPRRIVLQVRSTPFCLECFEKCPLQSSNSKQEDTASPIDAKGFALKQNNVIVQLHALNPASVSSSPSLSLVNTQEGESNGSPSETAFGSVCDEREFAQRATAEG